MTPQTTADPLAQVPPGVLGTLRWALTKLRSWEASLEHARQMERVSQQPGRYEYEIRYSERWTEVRHYVAQAEARLAQFAQLAAQNGVDAGAVLEALGGVPACSVEGPHVQEYRRS